MRAAADDLPPVVEDSLLFAGSDDDRDACKCRFLPPPSLLTG